MIEAEARFGVTLHERSAGKLLRRLGFARLSARPRHPLSDPEAQDAFKKPSPGWCARPCPSAHAASRSRSVWFQDEARVGRQGTLARIRARRGSRPRAPRDRRYAWTHLFGAVCPERAVGAGLVLPYANTEAMGLHLAEISRGVTPGAHAAVALDGAGWHGAPALRTPENLTLLPLPRRATARS